MNFNDSLSGVNTQFNLLRPKQSNDKNDIANYVPAQSYEQFIRYKLSNLTLVIGESEMFKIKEK